MKTKFTASETLLCPWCQHASIDRDPAEDYVVPNRLNHWFTHGCDNPQCEERFRVSETEPGIFTAEQIEPYPPKQNP